MRLSALLLLAALAGAAGCGDDSAPADARAADGAAGGPADARAADGAAGGPDARTPGSPFACLSATCDPTSEYCYRLEAGVAPAAAPVVGCNPLPAGCPAPTTCDCVTAALEPGDCAGIVVCNADSDAITVSCMLP